MLRTFAEAAAEYCAGVEKRVGQSLGKMLVLGVLAGAFIAFAGVAASIAGTVGGKLATAAVFPMGLAMVILGGSELFTGNCLFLLPVLGRKCRALDAARCWIAVYLANLVGAVAVAFLVTGAAYWTASQRRLLPRRRGRQAFLSGQPFCGGSSATFWYAWRCGWLFAPNQPGGRWFPCTGLFSCSFCAGLSIALPICTISRRGFSSPAGARWTGAAFSETWCL